MIEVRDLSMHYRVHDKAAGLAGSLRSFVNRRYTTVKAIERVSFEIAAGETVGLLGPNGAGKTTLLKMLSGLLHPTSGEVRVAGFTPRERRREFLGAITLVMGQKMQLAWDLTPADSFLVNKAIYDIPDRAYRERLGELVEMLELGAVVDRQVRKLSLGERMKCELVAALLHRPGLLFLDEPTIGLDLPMQRVLRDFIAAYNDLYGATVVLTSHYMADVTALARRILIIDAGRLIVDDDIVRLVEHLAPHKILKLRFFEHPRDEVLSGYARVRSRGMLEAELLVERGAVAETAARLLNDLPVADIGIEEVAVEDVVGQVFADARAEAAD